ncbi:hypothetical protein KY332_04485 [Candidatus Woesearchaeota archaeon]|nr:hypothetical protein [Candidatus Woesearchaeota archaeon]
MAKKKDKSVEEILAEHHGMHGKPFDDRMKKFEEFHDPDKGHQLRFAQHATYVVMGKPSDRKNYPGAHEESYKVLDKSAENDTDKIDDIEKITEILEKYVDTFLEKVHGKEFKEMIAAAEEDGLSKEEIREMKGQEFQRYHRGEKAGETIENILDEKYIKKLKGKKKMELIEELKEIAANSQKMYAMYLIHKAGEHLIEPTDKFNLHKYTTPIFEKAGFEHEDSPLTRSPFDVANDYAAFIRGFDMSQIGYKRRKVKTGPKKGRIDFTPAAKKYRKASGF